LQEKKLKMDEFQDEKNVYFGLLRDIALICRGKAKERNPDIQNIQNLLYSNEFQDEKNVYCGLLKDIAFICSGKAKERNPDIQKIRNLLYSNEVSII
jgi:hypothetical protein